MLSKWEKIAQSEGSSFELDVSSHLETLTSDAISRTAFGSSYEEGRKIFQLQKELATLLLKASLLFFIPGMRLFFHLLVVSVCVLCWKMEPNFGMNEKLNSQNLVTNK